MIIIMMIMIIMIIMMMIPLPAFCVENDLIHRRPPTIMKCHRQAELFRSERKEQPSTATTPLNNTPEGFCIWSTPRLSLLS